MFDATTIQNQFLVFIKRRNKKNVTDATKYTVLQGLKLIFFFFLMKNH